MSAQLKQLTELVQKAIAGGGGGGGGSGVGGPTPLNLHQALRDGVPGDRFHDFCYFYLFIYLFLLRIFFITGFTVRTGPSNLALRPASTDR